MADPGGQEKEFPATHKRRQDERKKGQVCQSREIASALILLTCVGLFAVFGRHLCAVLIDDSARQLTLVGIFELTPVTLKGLIAATVKPMLLIFAPLMCLVMVVGVASNVAQVGFVISGQPMAPNFNKLNPVSGAKRLFSIQGLVELVKSLAKIGIVGYVGAKTVLDRKDDLIPLMLRPPVEIASFTMKVSLLILFKCVLALVALAILDYMFQRHSYEKRLRMSRQEIKDELKDIEGNPQIKARIRRIMMDASMRRMMKEVPKADVVVTNPTHVAVALRYDSATMAAPRVTAKGKGVVAAAIRRRAEEAGVPIVQRPELARALERSVKVGGSIPRDLYRAVAEVLAYIYRLSEAV